MGDVGRGSWFELCINRGSFMDDYFISRARPVGRVGDRHVDSSPEVPPVGCGKKDNESRSGKGSVVNGE